MQGFIGCIGNTPLVRTSLEQDSSAAFRANDCGSWAQVRINSLSDATGCEVLAKAEFMNPGGSVKDRAAWGLVQWAEKSGKLREGGTVVEGTAGNTGIGLAHVCRARGYRCVIYMPNVSSPRETALLPSLTYGATQTQSQEKIDLLRMLGAEVNPVPGACHSLYARCASL